MAEGRTGIVSFGQNLPQGSRRIEDIISTLNPEDLTDDERRVLEQIQITNPQAIEEARQPKTIEELIRRTTPEALDIVRGGTNRALDLAGRATVQGVEGLQPFGGQESFREQSALLGAFGPEEQRLAIEGIPQTGAQQQADFRQQRSLLRQAASLGRFGGGATIDELQRLAGSQQAQGINRRLQGLRPLSDISRGAASTISGLGESEAIRRAGLLAGLGGQEANVLLGQAGEIVGARSSAAELAGLQDISRGNRQGDILSQTANLAGRVFDGPQTTPFNFSNFSLTGQQTTPAIGSNLSLLPR